MKYDIYKIIDKENFYFDNLFIFIYAKLICLTVCEVQSKGCCSYEM